MASGAIPTPLSPPRASPLSFSRMRPYLACGFSFMNLSLENEPRDCCNHSRQPNHYAKDFKKEPADSVSNEQSNDAENGHQKDGGKREVAGLQLVEDVLHQSMPGFRPDRKSVV